jgi:hypothetical protein
MSLLRFSSASQRTDKITSAGERAAGPARHTRSTVARCQL